MKISYDQIKSLFGSEEKSTSQLLLLISINYPTLSATDVANMFQVTFENYSLKSDHIMDMTAWHNKTFGGRTMLDISQNPTSPKVNYHSTYVYRNLWHIIDETDAWDEMIKSGKLSDKLEKIKDRLVEKLKRNYRDQIMLDKFEVVCEFINMIDKKKRALT